jgi:VPDSG-CTERM motif
MKLKTTPRTGAALLAALVLTSAANAAYINGKIDFGITAELDDSDLAVATEVSNWGIVLATLVSGDFDTYVDPGDFPTTFTDPWSFASGPVTPLWQIGGFTFDLTSSSIVTQNSTFLNVVGSGFVSGNSFDITPGTWSFTIANEGGGVGAANAFSFVSSTSSVPDGGTTFVLLGLSMLGLHGARRKFAKA